MSQPIMATSSTAAFISPFSAAHLGGESCWHPVQRLVNGCCNGDYWHLGTSLQLNGSRFVTIRSTRPSTMIHQSFEISSSVGSCARKLQACPSAHRDVGYNSEQEPPNNGTTVDLRLLQESPSSEHAGGRDEKQPAADREPHPYVGFHIGKKWKSIQGERNWENLLDPLDVVLRSELIRYGEFAQATYDAFDNNIFSRFCGSCRFRKAHILKRLGLENRGYEVIQYIYATSDIHLPKFFRKPNAPDDEKWSKDSNWVGFVAVCTSPEEIARLGRRDIVVAWRGTVTNFEWMEDIKTSQCPIEADPRRVGKGSYKSWNSVDLKVELGFWSLYKSKNENTRYNKCSARDQVLGALKRVMEKYKGEEMSITVTGHSLGGALATVCAYDIAQSELNGVFSSDSNNPSSTPASVNIVSSFTPTSDNNGVIRKTPIQARVPITAYTFASPRVGNSVFRDRLDELGVKVLRVVNAYDVVPYFPGLIFNDKVICLPIHIRWLRFCLLLKLLHKALALLPATYSHVGTELHLNNLHSPFLRKSVHPFNTHNLEVYLHLLDGYQGKRNGGFNAEKCGGRDLALVNKGTALLRPEHKIPPFWFQEENKGLVRVGGRFTCRPREPEDFPEQPKHLDNFDFELELLKKPPNRPHLSQPKNSM